MVITNLWGITFCIAIPIIISIVLVYLEGKEEGRKEYARINKVRLRKVNS